MLEFREEFFEQEIREGFYIDETMKRMWSAQLEVVQAIAEICDRHNLQWFAVYGTLLGAIRHEGYVPWDDDMDIGMMRADYMKFIKVLPEELPEGYVYYSPMDEKGYTEYHTLVLNGNTISISKDRLERFHGCPFSVGIDVFPFDYLPRNKEERKLQRTLFSLVARAIQMIKNLKDPSVKERGEEELEEDAYYEKELKEALKALKQYCNFKPDKKVIKEKDWEELYGPLWRLGNQLAMMYSEKESDYLVMYADFACTEYKKYPKEWFAEIYAATYEDFMIPVPCGYDEFLKTVYGDYLYRHRGGATHDYPYYNRQLKALRNHVMEFEGKAHEIGLMAKESMKVEMESAIPKEWEAFLDQKTEGKKLMLYGNEYEPFIEHGEKALDKLESALHTFYENRDKFILWWRAKPKMAQVLEQIDPQLAERYQRIRDQYVQDNWGILDESGNADLAAKNCDAYYGDMGYVLQPMQNQSKPILLVAYPNEDQIEE